MRYLGGKYRLREQIGEVIKEYRGLPLDSKVKPYWEPFVGSAWVTTQVEGGKIYASDINEYLIAMWESLQDGWEPPTEITEEEYHAIREGRKDVSKALMAFVGFGCSWGGKWFGGYARENGRNFAKNAHNSLLKQIKNLQNVNFFQANFLQTEPLEDNMVIYCDPPYKETTGYDGAGNWEPKKFWNRVRELTDKGHKLLVSEYQAPEDFEIIWQRQTKTDLNTKEGGKDDRIEKIFST